MTTLPTLTESLAAGTRYSGFRRAKAVWITSENLTIRFETGEWADSPAATFGTPVEFVGWIAGTEDGNGTADTVELSLSEFTAFLALPGFVAYDSPEALAAAEAFKATW